MHGCAGRTAEDAALMLDALVGFSRKSIRWRCQQAPAFAAKANDAAGLRIAYVSDISGIGVEPEIDAIAARL